MEIEGIEPRTFRMLSERVAAELQRRCRFSLITKPNPNSDHRETTNPDY